MENLHTAYEKEIRNILNLAIKQDKNFTNFEIEVFELVFNYCCYYLKHRREPSKKLRLLKSKPKDYYLLIDGWVSSGRKIRSCYMRLSSIVGDRKMSAYIYRLEKI